MTTQPKGKAQTTPKGNATKKKAKRVSPCHHCKSYSRCWRPGAGLGFINECLFHRPLESDK